jgi:large subunit ribosomal protein L9
MPLQEGAVSGSLHHKLWYNLQPQSVVPFALDFRRKGLGRNFLLPQRLAVLATPGAMKTVEKVRSKAEIQRTALNSELKDLADHINGVTLMFPVKAGETGKLYGSITSQDVATAIQEQTRYEVKRQQIDMQPIRELGEYKAHVRLTIDLMPEVKIVVRREGEAAEAAAEPEAKAAKGRARKQAEAAPAAETAEQPEPKTEEPSASE